MTSKSEKIDISFKGSADKTDQSSVGPQISTFSRKRAGVPAEDKVAPEDENKVEATEEPAEKQESSPDDATTNKLLEHPDVKELDGGFASSMHAPGERVSPGEPETDDKELDSEDSAFSKPATAEELAAESDALYANDKDFYTSKFNPDQTKRKSKRGQANASGRVNPLHLVRFWVILAIFITTSAAGFIMLYQLEQVYPGAGLIFDIMEQINIWQ